MIAELIGQGRFGGLWLSLRKITPARQFTRDELKQRISGSSGQLDFWFEFARLGDDWEICQHHVARSEALLPQVSQSLVRIAQGDGAQPVAQTIWFEEVDTRAVVNAGDTGDGQAAASLFPQ